MQGVRFEIWEQTGCEEFVYPSGVAILLVFAPPLVLCASCLAYYIRESTLHRLSRTRLIENSGLDLDILRPKAGNRRFFSWEQAAQPQPLLSYLDDGSRHLGQHGRCTGHDCI